MNEPSPSWRWGLISVARFAAYDAVRGLRLFLNRLNGLLITS